MQLPLEHSSLQSAFDRFRSSGDYWLLPLAVRSTFERIAAWLPSHEALSPLDELNASSAKRLRDKAARERGYKFGNMTLVFIQILVARAVEAGELDRNRVKYVSKLPPFRAPADFRRRSIVTIRRKLSAKTRQSKRDLVKK